MRVLSEINHRKDSLTYASPPASSSQLVQARPPPLSVPSQRGRPSGYKRITWSLSPPYHYTAGTWSLSPPYRYSAGTGGAVERSKAVGW